MRKPVGDLPDAVAAGGGVETNGMAEKKSNTFYMTTAIDYVNSEPHIGTAFEKIAADAISRFKRLQGRDTFFLMGNDEHSLNVYKEARAQNLDPQEYCDRMADRFKDTWVKLDIAYDDFIRTTDERHVAAVKEIFRRINDRGDIYKGKYEGWYCVSCEAFVQEKDLVEGKCPNHQTAPQWLSEDSYFFALSNYRDRLLEHIRDNPSFVVPEIRRNEIVNVLEGGLEDISVSRTAYQWGVPLPIDNSAIVYVWFDALINYISGAGFPSDDGRFKTLWPADLHVIGKDITRFHCIIWPAMLMSAGVELPKSVLGHGFVSFKGEKMSKSLGNIVRPLDVADKFGADPLRYYLLKEVPLEKDGDFTWELFIERYNADLANDLGNLVSRSLAMVGRYLEGEVPKLSRDELDLGLGELFEQVLAEYTSRMEGFQIHMAVQEIWKLIRQANRYIEEKAPWVLAKDPARRDELERVLATLLEVIRTTAVMLVPIMPSKASVMWERLGLEGKPAEQKLAGLRWGEPSARSPEPIKAPAPLFPRIEG
jgi:methionyl-tRNA synthetase